MDSNKPNEKSIYSSRTIDPYIKLIKDRYHLVDIDEILRYADIDPWEAADQSHWFTQEQINRFVKRAVELTGNKGSVSYTHLRAHET